MITKKPNINRSNKLYSIGQKIIPSGGQTYSKGVTQFTEGVAPKYLESGKGAYAIDVDGNKYIDYVLACQPLILGYSDPDVNKAITNQLKKGWNQKNHYCPMVSMPDWLLFPTHISHCRQLIYH